MSTTHGVSDAYPKLETVRSALHYAATVPVSQELPEISTSGTDGISLAFPEVGQVRSALLKTVGKNIGQTILANE